MASCVEGRQVYHNSYEVLWWWGVSVCVCVWDRDHIIHAAWIYIITHISPFLAISPYSLYDLYSTICLLVQPPPGETCYLIKSLDE